MKYDYLKKILFKLDPEKCHTFAIKSMAFYSWLIENNIIPLNINKKKIKKIDGIFFPNPVGLAAGFDKNAKCILALQNLGFGFIEIGTVTRLPNKGNLVYPRIKRSIDNTSLYNNLGLPNDGVEVIKNRIQRLREKDLIKIPIGINIGDKLGNSTEECINNTIYVLSQIYQLSDFIVLNISCPNIKLKFNIFEYIKNIGIFNSKLNDKKPLYLKLSIINSNYNLLKKTQTAIDYGFQGFVISNTYPSKKGGISGLSIFNLSTKMVSVVRDMHPNCTIIGSGGIINEKKAHEKFKNGSDLIEIYTGLIYKGPNLIHDILKDIK